MAKRTQLLLLLSLIVLPLFPLSSALSPNAVTNAAEILSNSGFVSMALTLELISPTILAPQQQSATIFSPSDAAFVQSGQPSLSLLQFHFAPLAFSLESLRSLPFGTKIPTLSPGNSLIVTTIDNIQQVSLNNVTINGSPIFDDGSLVVFGIDMFFDPNFKVSSPAQSPSPDLRCVVSEAAEITSSGGYSFDEASRMMRTRGYSVMASFLDMQLLGFLDRSELTVFAPIDDVMLEFTGNFSAYSSLLLRHVVPCKLTWSDLNNFQDGTVLRTFLDGFTIRISKFNDLLMLNEVPLTFPDMYFSDWLVVHGVHEVIEQPETTERVPQASSEFGLGEEEKEKELTPDRTEF